MEEKELAIKVVLANKLGVFQGNSLPWQEPPGLADLLYKVPHLPLQLIAEQYGPEFYPKPRGASAWAYVDVKNREPSFP